MTQARFTGATGRVWVLLRRGREVSIDDLYEAAYPHLPKYTLRGRQMRVGALVSKLNAKLNGKRVGPGGRRRTYRLQAVD